MESTQGQKLPFDPAPHDPYSPAELAKHIDRILYDALGIIQYDRLARKQVTVVFWDVSGFSKLCNKLYGFDDSVNYFLKIYYGKAIEIIEKHHGALDKFMGDGILAYFGYNTINGDPFSAIDAALEFKEQFPAIKKLLVQYCENSHRKKVTPIDLKCGMVNGPAFFHYFSTPTRNSVIVLGPTLNLASRLEGIAKNNQIVVSEDLGDMIYENYELRKKKIPENDRIPSFEEENAYYIVKRKR